jgi:hypothetical protein
MDALMRRFELFELNDHPLFPTVPHDLMTDVLQAV